MKRTILNSLGIYLLLCLALMVYPILNGYPVVYSDTASYLGNGFALEMPFDRPITYGLFMVLTSFFGISLWLTVICQSLIAAWTIKTFRDLFFKDLTDTALILTTLIISVIPGLSWYTGQLMPDFLTGIAFLCLLIGLHPLAGMNMRIAAGIFFMLAAASHISHPVFLLALIILLYMSGVLFRGIVVDFIKTGRFPLYIFLTVLSYLLMLTPVSKSSHVFLMGTLVENGILKEYLEKHCGEKHYTLCDWKDRLPGKAWEFIWEPGALDAGGGWKGTKTEYREIIRGTFTDPVLLKKHISKSVSNTFRQLSLMKNGDGNGPFLPGSLNDRRISERVGMEIDSFRQARQQQGLGRMLILNPVIPWFVLFSISLMSIIVFLTRKKQKGWIYLFLFVCIAVIVNAFICATFSGATDRLNGRIIWLIPMISIMMVWSLLADHFSKFKSKA